MDQAIDRLIRRGHVQVADVLSDIELRIRHVAECRELRTFETGQFLAEDDRDDAAAAPGEDFYLMLDRLGITHGSLRRDQHQTLSIFQCDLPNGFPVVASCVVRAIQKHVIMQASQSLCQIDGILAAGRPLIRNEKIITPQSVDDPLKEVAFDVKHLGNQRLIWIDWFRTIIDRHISPCTLRRPESKSEMETCLQVAARINSETSINFAAWNRCAFPK